MNANQQQIDKTKHNFLFPEINKQTKIGNYILKKSLGDGTFGKVYIGNHILTGEKVAIKMIDKTKLKEHYSLQRVNRQIKNLNKLRHGSIVQLYQSFENQRFLYLIMQYLAEGELFNYIIRKKRLQQDEACNIFRQIILGIQYSHQCGIAHRDLKPENILLDHDFRIRIIDFGLSNSYAKNQRLKTCCGSPCYVAPEMVDGLHAYDPIKVDIWSAGVILYAMVCGCLPFVDDSPIKIYQKIKIGHFKVPKNLSSQIKNLLSRIFTVNPQKRITIDEIKCHKWMELSSHIKSYGILPQMRCVFIDNSIVDKMIAYGINGKQCRNQIYNKKLTSSTATYYILLKKSVKQGGSSKYYLGCNNFNIQLLQDKNGIQFKNQEQSTDLACLLQQNHSNRPPEASSQFIKDQNNFQMFLKMFEYFPSKEFPLIKPLTQKYTSLRHKKQSLIKAKQLFNKKQIKIYEAYRPRQHQYHDYRYSNNKSSHFQLRRQIQSISRQICQKDKNLIIQHKNRMKTTNKLPKISIVWPK